MPVTLVTAVTDDVCVTRKRARSRGLRRTCYRRVSDRLRMKNGEKVNDFYSCYVCFACNATPRRSVRGMGISRFV